MESIRQYIFSVVSAAILCGCIRTLVDGKSASGQVVKLICALFLSFTVVRPIADIQIQDFAIFTADIQSQARAAAVTGEDFTREAMVQIIKDKTEAYILDKAEALNAPISVSVTVNEEHLLPECVRISGSISPYAKQVLTKIIQEDLGIPKEEQRWRQ